MKTRYRSRLSGEFFKSEDEVIEHLEKEGIDDHFEAYYDIISLSEEDIKELEGKFRKYCEENPDDPNCKEYNGEVNGTPESKTEPSDIDSMSEEELLNLARAKISADQYLEGELSPTEEKQLLSRLLGQVGDKSVDKKIHDKVFAPRSTTRTAFKDYYTNVIEDLQDESKIACPQCGKLWSDISEDLKENLAQNEQYEVGIPLIRLHHVKASHPSIWKLISDLFGKSSEEITDERVSTTPNPESCSDDEPEKLSKEQLAERINSEEELRHQFFREWLRRLKKRK